MGEKWGEGVKKRNIVWKRVEAWWKWSIGTSFLVFAEKAGISVPIATGIVEEVARGASAAMELV